MDCETLRERLHQNPASLDDECAEHESSCPSCAAYAARVRAAEALVQGALRFDVAALKSRYPDERAKAEARRASMVATAPAGGRWAPALAGAAAGVVATVAVWIFMTPSPNLSSAELATAVVDHWYHEPDSWVRADTAVSLPSLTLALDGKAEIDLEALGKISYARSCFVAGRWIPHLVVQGDAGPFMVLLMPEQSVQSPVPLALEDQSLEGHVVPVGRGSIAVLGADGQESIEVEQAVAAAVEWTI